MSKTPNESGSPVELAVSCLLLVRHGESQANLERRFTRDDDEPLTPRGVEQARATGRQLREHYRPVALYSSPFLRALHTAREIGKCLELEPVVVPRLHEQSFGEMRGEPYERYYPLARALVGEERWRHVPPGGESLLQVVRRVGPAIDDIARQHAGEQVVVVSHGGVMAAVRAHVAGHYDLDPEPTGNAGGYLVLGCPPRYRAPAPLFSEEVGLPVELNSVD